MLTLFCAVVGGKGSAFSITIEASKSVDHLKKAIKAEKPHKITCDADELELFLAKKGDAWLNRDGAAAVTLDKERQAVVEDENGSRQSFDAMDETSDIVDYFREDFKRKRGEIHVLVVLPPEETPNDTVATGRDLWKIIVEELGDVKSQVGDVKSQVKQLGDAQKNVNLLLEKKRDRFECEKSAEAIPKLTPLVMLLKQCKVVGDLPQAGDFLKLFEWTDDDCGKVVDIKEINDIVHFTGSKFYVRKEILCVLENFKTIYHTEFETHELVNQQFILMGSPGTGKSCILALMCFYIAVYYKRPVVWFRQVVGGLYPTTTLLLYQGKYYEWEDKEGTMYNSLYDTIKDSGINPINCWFCLDGMCQTEVNNRRWYNMYKLLATSGQFSPKPEAVPFVKMCLVPYWRQTDLEDFGLNHMQMQDIDVDARFYVSGGSLREFLNDGATTTVKSALNCIGKPEDAENLLTMYGVGSNKQIDRIRMRGVQDRNNAEHYVDLWKWTSCVMSKLALQHLAAMMKPNFFEKLMGIAKGMNDDRLEGAAFEGYFHTLVRHRRSICAHYCKYDNVDRRMVDNWGDLMRQEMGSIDCMEQSVVECVGGNMKECVSVMESWAANPSKMDYWIPATSLCETIDAVAKWTLPGNQVRFCFLQLTKATTHKCKATILWELAQPFVNRQLRVCYIALLPDEHRILEFRLSPVRITKKEVLDHIPLYVAHFELLD